MLTFHLLSPPPLTTTTFFRCQPSTSQRRVDSSWQRHFRSLRLPCQRQCDAFEWRRRRRRRGDADGWWLSYSSTFSRLWRPGIVSFRQSTRYHVALSPNASREQVLLPRHNLWFINHSFFCRLSMIHSGGSSLSRIFYLYLFAVIQLLGFD